MSIKLFDTQHNNANLDDEHKLKVNLGKILIGCPLCFISNADAFIAPINGFTSEDI